jgi:hypothetical protein
MEHSGSDDDARPTPVVMPTSREEVHREALERLQSAPLSVVEDEPAQTRRRKIRDQPPQIRRKKRP